MIRRQNSAFRCVGELNLEGYERTGQAGKQKNGEEDPHCHYYSLNKKMGAAQQTDF